MKRLRLRLLLLAVWLVVFYNLARLLAPAGITDLPFTLGMVVVMAILVLPHFHRLPDWLVLAVPPACLLLYEGLSKTLLANLADGGFFLELGILEMTALLAFGVNRAVHEFEQAVSVLTLGENPRVLQVDASGQRMVYREVRRARNHQRPLTVLAVAVEETSNQTAQERLIQEAQQRLLGQYTLARVSQALCDGLEDSDLVIQDQDHFLIVLPETNPEHILGLTRRLRQLIAEKVGVELKIGTACLPADGYTLEGLLDKAVREMQSDEVSYHAIDIEQLRIKHKVT